MVIVIINQNRIFAFKHKSKPPVSIYGHRPMAFEFPTQRMQPPAGGVHVSGGARIVQGEELLAQPLGMAGLNLGFRPCSKEQFDTFVTKAFNHSYSV